jgi:hypothetical protein
LPPPAAQRHLPGTICRQPFSTRMW